MKQATTLQMRNIVHEEARKLKTTLWSTWTDKNSKSDSEGSRTVTFAVGGSGAEPLRAAVRAVCIEQGIDNGLWVTESEEGYEYLRMYATIPA